MIYINVIIYYFKNIQILFQNDRFSMKLTLISARWTFFFSQQVVYLMAFLCKFFVGVNALWQSGLTFWTFRFPVGAEVGWEVVGFQVGKEVGWNDGVTGASVGSNVGLPVVGLNVGLQVGFRVGIEVDGFWVGFAVGCKVDGANVGILVGSLKIMDAVIA